MRRQDLEAMDFEELWLLHEELTKILAEKITAEKRELEKRLAQLNQPDQFGEAESGASETGTSQPRRKYPKVVPKYYNPLQPTETWSGRGKQPRWLVAALQSGHTLEEFKIRENGESSEGNPGGREHS
ncbi:H-NS histone family protein [Bradyrhizobium sp. 182]|uniref:H-NS histone family protein n=1 Tax=unclassified Bradyrhizobium TaxID=2631580 RepID=UPI001FFBCBDB|nr:MULTISPECIES: H-NS histone family protein [unclassified Bradyrhizobium]MCK1424859.1 H-NS histone family protein [Bradyrhizobium sp. CW12]MCK1531889.1 H-NS histone family protein [Bradyrhizobium sp. 182]MCK1646540.1 H-NS histone family protein [Bradyrhizobium sp. 154]